MTSTPHRVRVDAPLRNALLARDGASGGIAPAMNFTTSSLPDSCDRQLCVRRVARAQRRRLADDVEERLAWAHGIFESLNL
jgi:hypothetical protein